MMQAVALEVGLCLLRVVAVREADERKPLWHVGDPVLGQEHARDVAEAAEDLPQLVFDCLVADL